MKKETEQDNAFAWLVLLAAFAQGFIERAINRSPTVFNIEWREYFDADYTQVLAISATFDATACFGGKYETMTHDLSQALSMSIGYFFFVNVKHEA